MGKNVEFRHNGVFEVKWYYTSAHEFKTEHLADIIEKSKALVSSIDVKELKVTKRVDGDYDWTFEFQDERSYESIVHFDNGNVRLKASHVDFIDVRELLAHNDFRTFLLPFIKGHGVETFTLEGAS